MKKKFIFVVVAISSIFFLACEEEAIPVPLPPPPSPSQSTDESGSPGSQEQINDGITAPEPVPEHDLTKPEPSPKASKAVESFAKEYVPAHASAFGSGDADQQSYGRYTIQIAVFPNEASAKKLIKKMADNGINSYSAKVNNPSTLYGLYHRVRIGYFSGRSDAESFARAKLEPLGYAWWVDLAKHDNIGNPYANSEDKAAAKAAAKEAAKESAKARAKEAANNASNDKEAAKKQAAKQAAREAAIEAGKAAREAAREEATAKAPAVPPPKIPGK